MKKAMVYLLALTLAFSTMLAGCGEMRGTNTDTDRPAGTPAPTVLPETATPDPADGEVRDRDGIITDGDTGAVNEGGTALPKTTANHAGKGERVTGNPATGTTAGTMR